MLARRTPKKAKQRGLLEPGLEPGPRQSRRPNGRGQARMRSCQGPPDTNKKPEARRQQRPEAGRPARCRGQRPRPDIAERLVANAGQNLKAKARRFFFLPAAEFFLPWTESGNLKTKQLLQIIMGCTAGMATAPYPHDLPDTTVASVCKGSC